ncbi:MAG TPA: CheR family methyltransferase [Candidatus Dormibacteraeota bacterium]
MSSQGALEAGKEFEALLHFLRESRGFNYTGYKRNTMVRRIGQRCTELGLKSFSAYQDYLQVHPDEFAILFDKILINVTAFFRDPEAWDYLREEIVPKIVAKSGVIRIWSTGTASGEEAYSAAMLFCEALGPETFLRRVKIYATDVDEAALNTARTGYSDKELEALDPDLRSKYFEAQGGKFVFKAALRRALIFGRHDLMQDAPISRLDLLICRNTLMYFTAETQGRVLARFHYALDDDGYLFLGRAEMLLMHGSIFEPVDLKQRLFKKVLRAPLRDRLLILAQAGSAEASEQMNRQARLQELASDGLPFAQLVVDALGNLALANPPARKLLDIRAGDIGRPLKDLELSYRPVDLRGPIDQTFRDRRAVAIPGIEHPSPEGTMRRFDVQVSPLSDDGGAIVGTSVTFVDVSNESALRSELERSKHMVETAYEELQSSNEELETTNEELQSTVEELETTNEELQSTNEELETMNEELESTNSELQGVNTDLHQRSDDLNRLNVFLNAIIGNIKLGAAVLDADLNVQVWNDRAADLWGLRSDEVVGESFFDLDIGMPVKELRPMIRSVLRGKPSHDQKEVAAVTRRGKRIQCRVVATVLAGRGRAGGVVLMMEELKA